MNDTLFSILVLAAWVGFEWRIIRLERRLADIEAMLNEPQG